MLKVPHCSPATDPRFSKVTLEYSLGLNLVYTNFGVLILVMRDGEIVTVQFRHQNARLCASLLESSPAKRNGRDPSVRKHPKLHRRPDKGAYAARRNSCHQPCLLPVQW